MKAPGSVAEVSSHHSCLTSSLAGPDHLPVTTGGDSKWLLTKAECYSVINPSGRHGRAQAGGGCGAAGSPPPACCPVKAVALQALVATGDSPGSGLPIETRRLLVCCLCPKVQAGSCRAGSHRVALGWVRGGRAGCSEQGPASGSLCPSCAPVTDLHGESG